MRIRANGIDIEYRIEGEGPWVTLSHSLAFTNALWEPQIGVLSRHYRVLRYDTRGHGGTSATPPPYTLEQLAEDARALFDALGIEHTHWVGLSLGGMIGQALALKHPERLCSLVLCDTTSRHPAGASATWDERIRTLNEKGMAALAQPSLDRWLTEPYRKAHPEVVRSFASTIGATSVDGFAGCGRAISQIDFTDRLGGLRIPTLIMVGEQDTGTTVAVAREIEQAIPGAELVVLPSAAHLSNVEQPDRFNETLLAFLRRNTP